MILAIAVDQPPEPDEAPVEACRACGGEGRTYEGPIAFGALVSSGWRTCRHCDGTGDEARELARDMRRTHVVGRLGASLLVRPREIDRATPKRF